MWSLSGSGVIYGKELEITHKPLSAVIDTGTTMLMVPKNVFSVLVEEWYAALGSDMQCQDIICIIERDCE